MYPKHVPFLIKPLANKICDGVKGGLLIHVLKSTVHIWKIIYLHDYFAGDFSFADIQ